MEIESVCVHVCVFERDEHNNMINSNVNELQPLTNCLQSFIFHALLFSH